MTILHIDSAITGEHSVSRELTAAIVAALTEVDPTSNVTYRDLAAEPLSHLTLPAFAEADSAEALAQFKVDPQCAIRGNCHQGPTPAVAEIEGHCVVGEERFAVAIRQDDQPCGIPTEAPAQDLPHGDMRCPVALTQPLTLQPFPLGVLNVGEQRLVVGHGLQIDGQHQQFVHRRRTVHRRPGSISAIGGIHHAASVVDSGGPAIRHGKAH